MSIFNTDRNRPLTLLGAALLLCSGGASAEESCLPKTQDSKSIQNVVAEIACREKARSMVDPSLTSPTRRTEFQAFVSATREDTSVAVEFGLKTKEDKKKDNVASVRHAFKISGPIGKKDSEADLATLEGLQDNAKLGYVFSWRSVDPIKAFRTLPAEEWTELLCEAYEKDKLPLPEECAPKGKAEGADKPNDGPGLDIEELKFRGAGYKHLLEKMGLLEGSWLLGLEAIYAASKKFDFITSESLEKQSVKHDGAAVTLGLGWLPYRHGFYYLGLSYRWEEGYVGQKEQEICQPFGDDLGALSCSSVAVGEPKKSKKQVASVELRKYFRGGSLALNPRYSYDFEKEVSGVRLPLYFLKDGKGVLNGGIAVGWRSDTEDYTLSVFVGSMKNPLK